MPDPITYLFLIEKHFNMIVPYFSFPYYSPLFLPLLEPLSRKKISLKVSLFYPKKE